MKTWYCVTSSFDDRGRAIAAITATKEAENISINPMNYVNKIVVAYKNPGHNFATPYITSIYSGMMLDKYV